MNTKKKFKTKHIQQPKITVENQIEDSFNSDTLCLFSDACEIGLCWACDPTTKCRFRKVF